MHATSTRVEQYVLQALVGLYRVALGQGCTIRATSTRVVHYDATRTRFYITCYKH